MPLSVRNSEASTLKRLPLSLRSRLPRPVTEWLPGWTRSLRLTRMLSRSRCPRSSDLFIVYVYQNVLDILQLVASYE